MPYGSISNTDVDALEDIKVIDVQGYRKLFVDFVVGVANLTAFTIEAQFRPNGPWIPVAANAGSYTSPVYPLEKASADLSAPAFGSTVYHFRMDVTGLCRVRIKAAGANTTIIGGYGLG